MNSITDSEIKSIIKKHTGFAIFLVFVPIIFTLLISYFSGEHQLHSLWFFVAPISSVGACAHFVQCVLIDINANRAINT